MYNNESVYARLRMLLEEVYQEGYCDGQNSIIGYVGNRIQSIKFKEDVDEESRGNLENET